MQFTRISSIRISVIIRACCARCNFGYLNMHLLLKLILDAFWLEFCDIIFRFFNNVRFFLAHICSDSWTYLTIKLISGQIDKFCGNYNHEKTIASSNINKTERTCDMFDFRMKKYHCLEPQRICERL